MNLTADNEHGEDFTLTADHVWITVDNLSIRINKGGIKTKVAVWELGKEAEDDPIDCMTIYQDAQFRE